MYSWWLLDCACTYLEIWHFRDRTTDGMIIKSSNDLHSSRSHKSPQQFNFLKLCNLNLIARNYSDIKTTSTLMHVFLKFNSKLIFFGIVGTYKNRNDDKIATSLH